MFEQRNPYKGRPLRPWVRLRFIDRNGSTEEVECLADTGSPVAAILSGATASRLKWYDGPVVNSNFGLLAGAWVQLNMPELGLVRRVLCFAGDPMVAVAKASSSDFEGVAGLPLLRLVEYGGDAHSFWLRSPGAP